MKRDKILLWSLLAVGVLVAVLLIVNLAHGGVFVLEGLNGRDGADGKNGVDGIDGENGQNGADGKDGLNGQDGQDGQNGKSAYELAVEDGFEGSLHEWLLSLAVRGSNGVNGVNGKDGVNGTNGKDGVGIRNAHVDSTGALLITLTDGTVLNAGKVGTSEGGFSAIPDADGFYEVYETVVMNDPATAHLNLRSGPDLSTEILFSISRGDEVLRIGDQKTPDGYSRFLYKDQICYARSKYFEVKYVYDGVIPSINLPDSIMLTAKEVSYFYIDQVIPQLPEGLSVVWLYSGEGARILQQDSFAITPTWKTDLDNPAHAPERATLTVRVQTLDGGEIKTVTEKTVNVTVVARQDELALKGILIGDSRISDNTIVSTLLSDFPNLELLGTRQTASSGKMHEGRASWSIDDYLTKPSKTVAGVLVENAFYNPATGGFDFAYYMEQTAFPDPDFVVFNLGANDGFSEKSVEKLNIMLASVKNYAESKSVTIRILIFGEYRSPADRYCLVRDSTLDVWAMRVRQAAYFEAFAEAFDGREDEGIYLLPTHAGINAWSDWNRCLTDAVDGESAEMIDDVIHLGTNGYRKEEAVLRAYLYGLFGDRVTTP